MKCLVTGGAGFIGAHTIIALMGRGIQPVVVDNFCNASLKNIKAVEAITGKKIAYYRLDVRDEDLRAIFKKEAFDAVIHFAALKSVPDSIKQPIEYYDNNVHGLINLLKVMDAFEVRKLVFSSSAAVYGSDTLSPITEESVLAPKTPYGRTKLIGEDICRNVVASSNTWNVICLRYFNPVGAHESGLLGDDPESTATNLFPVIGDVATKKRDVVEVFGTDYATRDGSAVRDYIHVMDLAEGHLAALNFIARGNACGDKFQIINLGTGRGSSVFEIISLYKKISNEDIKVVESPRREGDLTEVFADTTKAMTVLNWSAKRGLEKMVMDEWNFRSSPGRGE